MNKKLILLFALSLTSLLPHPVRAQFWDPDGTVPGTGISGNWDTVMANWSTGFDVGGNVVWVQGDTANFNVESNYTVTVAEAITVGGITVSGAAGALTIDRTAANALTLGGDSIFNIGGSRTVNLSAPIAGGFILTKNGNGTLNLSGANTYSGGTTLSGGTIGIGIDSVSSGGVITSGALGTAPLTFSAAATVVASGAARTVHNPVVLNGGLTNNGTLGLTFTNATFKINGGTRNVVVNNTADLIIGSDLIDDGTARTMQKIGPGRLILAGNNSNYLGQITVVAGTLAPGKATSLYTSNSISVSAGATLNLNGFDANVWRLAGAGSVVLGTNTLTFVNYASAGVEFSGVISGTGGLVKAGPISQVLSGTNTFTGGILITEGPIYFPTNAITGSPIALGAGTNTITIANNGQIGQNKIGLSILTNAVVLANVGPTAVLTPAGAGTVEFILAGPVSGSGGFLRTTTGSGVVALSGNNTFTGGVQMDNRILGLGHKNALGRGTFIIGNPTTPPVNTIVIATTTDLSGANSVTNVTTINQNFTIAATNNFELSGPITLAAGVKTNTVSSTALTKISGAIGGAGGLGKAGASTLTLSAANAYTGSTIILEGTLALVGSGSVASSSDITVVSGATLDASGRTDGTLTVGAAQTLKGVGTFNVTGNLTNHGVIELQVTKSGSVSSDSIQGLYSIRYGGTLNLVLSGDPLTNSDSIKLFDATNYVGSFATILPPTPGSGLAWDTSTLTTDGTLRIVLVPSFTATTLLGTNLVMSGSNGTAGGSYSVLSSTSITTARSNWTVVQSGSFDLNGGFSVTNGIVPGEPQRYFSIRVP